MFHKGHLSAQWRVHNLMASQLGRRLVLAFALLFFLIALHLILKDLE